MEKTKGTSEQIAPFGLGKHLAGICALRAAAPLALRKCSLNRTGSTALFSLPSARLARQSAYRIYAERPKLRLAALALSLALLVNLAGCAAPEQEALPAAAPAPTATPTPTPAPAAADPDRADKTETVYVKAAADGAVQEISVETVLKNPGGGQAIPDVSNLREIRNTKGEEEFTRDGQTLRWQNLGEDIYYKGISDAALPVEVRISYLLDGQPIDPAELAGRSGQVTIRFDYENRERRTVEVDGRVMEASVPFTAVTMLALGDSFSGIRVTNGKTVELDDQTMVLGYAFPGLADSLRLTDYEPTEEAELPEYVEITAYTTGFTLEFTATVVTNGLLSDLEDEDLDEVNDMTDSMDELRDASGELADGAEELLNGMVKMKDYLNQYAEGASALAEGADLLAAGMFELDAQKSKLSEGAAALQGGLEELDANSDALNDGLAQLADAVLAAANAQLAAYATPESAAPLLTWETYADTLDQLAALLPDGEGRQAMLALKAQLDGMAQLTAGLRAYTGGVAALAEGSGQLTEGVCAFNKAIEQLTAGMRSLSWGADDLRDAGGALTEGAVALIEGGVAFRDGVAEFDREGIRELSKLAGEELTALTRRLRAANRADLAYTNFAGLAPGQTGAVRFLIETEEIKP